MYFYFSPQLIARTQAYFEKKHGRLLSIEEANDHLNSFADLFVVMGKATTARLKAAGAPDLIHHPLNSSEINS